MLKVIEKNSGVTLASEATESVKKADDKKAALTTMAATANAKSQEMGLKATYELVEVAEADD